MAQIKDITKMSEEELRERFSLKDLKERVKQMEIVKDPSEFRTKGQLIQLLKLAGKKRPTSGPSQSQKDQNRYEAKKEKERQRLKNQRKTPVFLPLTGKEKKGVIVERVDEQTGEVEEVRVGAWLPVTINGVKNYVPKGVSTEVPIDVANLIGQYQEKTQEAKSRFLIEGEKKKRALS